MHDDTPPRGTVSRLISRMTREENRRRRRREKERRDGGEGLCRVYKKETTEVLPFLCRVEYLSFNPVECDKSFCPFSLCLLSSSIFPLPVHFLLSFHFSSLFRRAFSFSSFSPFFSPLLLNPSCSISPSSSLLLSPRNVLRSNEYLILTYPPRGGRCKRE